MNDQAVGQFLLLMALLFGLTYLLAGFMEHLKIPGILAALFVAMGAHYTPLGDLLTHGIFNDLFTVLAELGVLFLLFFIGLQIDMKEMRMQSGNIILATVLNTLIPCIIGIGVMRYLGYDWIVSFVVGLTRMPTAEAVIVPILDEFNLIRTKVGNYIVGAGVLDDVMEVFLIAFVSLWIGDKVAWSAMIPVRSLSWVPMYCSSSLLHGSYGNGYFSHSHIGLRYVFQTLFF